MAFVLCWTTFASGASPELQPAVLELIVNGARRGDVFVLLRGDDVLVPLQSLHDAGLVRLRVPTEDHAGVAHVALAAVSLPFVYDLATLSLTITAPPAVLAKASIDLAATAPGDLQYAHDPSLIVNYAPRLIDTREFQAFGETGLSLGKALVESSGSYDSRTGPLRLITRATYDDRARLRTATLGDTFVSAGPLGAALTLGGLSFARNYELDPYLTKIPRLGFSGDALSPSTVDVYVNDVLVRRVPVAPGQFQLTNITPLSGVGTTRYVLRDAYGQEQRLESAYYSSASVLAPGLSEFSYGIGLVREGFGRRSFDYGSPAMLGRHRFGLTDHVTPGFHAEFDPSLANVGADVTLVGTFGDMELHAAASLGTEQGAQAGGAGIISYGYRGRRASMQIVLRATSRHFATLSLGEDQPRNLLEQVTSTSHSLGSGVAVGTALALGLSQELQPLARFGVSAGARLSAGLGWSLQASRSQREYGVWEDDLFTALTWSLPGQHSAQAGMHASGRAVEATAVLSRSMPYPTGVGYQFSAATGTVNRAAASLQGQTKFGTLSGSYTYLDGQSSTLLEASGGIVIVGGMAYSTRPVSQSFAVLELPGVPDVRGYLNNREMGTTDADGRLFVPDLAAYQANLLRINQADLPIDYEFERDEVTLAPMSKGGAVVKFATHAVRLARGRIVRGVGSREEPVRYGKLSVTAPTGTVTSLLGNDGEFELDGVPQGRWPGEVEADEIRCTVSIQIPTTDVVVADLGALQCIHLPSARPARPVP
jgi:outer membrane usher protein